MQAAKGFPMFSEKFRIVSGKSYPLGCAIAPKESRFQTSFERTARTIDEGSMGRGPRATISFTYCMARAESIVGSGPLSGGSDSLGADVSAAGGCVCAFTALALLSCPQASSAAIKSSRIEIAIFLRVIFC